MFGAQDPGLVSRILTQIAQDPEKTQRAFLAIEASRMTQNELFMKFGSLPLNVQQSCFEKLQRIAKD